MRSADAKHPWVALTALCLGMLVASLDTTIVNVTLPRLVTGLHAGLDQVLWVVNGYVLVYAALLITGGRLGDVLGSRRMLLTGLVLFTLASALCGVSGSVTQLVLARILQGLAGAVMVPQVMALISAIFPAERRGAAFGLLSATAGVAAVSGPVLGGLIVTDWSWRWVFYINVPICAAACVLTVLFVPDARPARRHRFDLLGIVLITAGLGGITYGLIEGQHYDWGTVTGSVTIPEIIAAGAVVLAGFVWWEGRHAEPLVPLALFRYRSFSVANSVNAVLYLTMYGVTLLVSLHLQSVAGMSALRTGLTYLPMAFAMGFISVPAGRLTDRVGGRSLMFGGLVILAAGIGLLAWVESGTATASTFVGPLLVVGIGIAFVMAPATTEAMRELPAKLAGASSGVFNSSRQVAGAIGVAVVGAVLQNRMTSEISDNAARLAQQLPPGERARFAHELPRMVGGGGVITRSGGSGGTGLFQRLAHEAYANAFAAGERPALWLLIGLVVVGAASCLLLRRAPTRDETAGQAPAERRPQEEAA
ncbi:DHA2 family efflux MFS transporter permease subunit [Actinoallomurus sp. CA-150999]|uniref:DHA2 family efflux MFS transporter permease subunit n=1 Tax=Actinoallomurus sp. CA-150999 TaxID=3239887 RepID=UPI003D91ED54